MANRIKKKTNTVVSAQEGFATIMSIFAILVLCFLPVMVTNSYFNILETKYITYCVLSITMFAVMFLYGLMKGSIAQTGEHQAHYQKTNQDGSATDQPSLTVGQFHPFCYVQQGFVVLFRRGISHWCCLLPGSLRFWSSADRSAPWWRYGHRPRR